MIHTEERNVSLLAGYDYTRYPSAITGYTGQDLQCIHTVRRHGGAVRTRVGGRGNYKAGMARLTDGRILLAVCREAAERHTDPGKHPFRMAVYDSEDCGVTWREIADPDVVGKEPSLTVAADGTIIMTAQHADFEQAERPQEAWVCRSPDGGYTWEKTLIPGAGYPRNVIVEKDGSLLFLRSKLDRETLELCRSVDHGKTWHFTDARVDWNPEDRSSFGEISVIRLRNGKLIAALRRALPAAQSGTLTRGQRAHGFADSVLTESASDGKSWSAPRRFTHTAEVHVHLLQLTDGRLLATYVNYHQPFGVAAILSKDDGKTWDLDTRIQLSFSAVGPTGNNGWPVTLQLERGDLLTCFANNAYPNDEPPTVACEVVRWRLP